MLCCYEPPKTIKTDISPTYTSSQSQQLLLYLWNMMYVTGIPHNPTGQAKQFTKIILQ